MDLLEQIRQDAEKYDKEILALLARRVRYSANLSYYTDNPVYADILREACYLDDAKLTKKVRKLDNELEKAIKKRCCEIGLRIADYKLPRAMPIYCPEIEKEKIDFRKQDARGLGINEYGVENMFKIIFRETRRIEEEAETRRIWQMAVE